MCCPGSRSVNELVCRSIYVVKLFVLASRIIYLLALVWLSSVPLRITYAGS